MPRVSSGPSVTLLDVAQHLGLSRATVSLVLRDSPLVAADTRQRVLDAFKELGYVYNRHAAGMRSRRTQTVAIVVNDITNPYFSTLVSAIEATLNAEGFVTFVSNSDESVERQHWFLQTVRTHNIDGIVIVPAEGTTEADLREVLSWGIPCVLASRYVPGVQIDYASTDNTQGMALATAHLIGLKHKRIAMIGGLTRSSTGHDRQAGYLAALEAAGLRPQPRLIVPARLTREEGKRIVQELLRQPNPPTAAVCGNDVIAFGAMLGLRAMGVEPGRGFALVGFDDVPEAALWDPGLSTVRVVQPDIGRAAAELLLQRIKDGSRPTTQQLTEPLLIVRGTSAAPGASV